MAESRARTLANLANTNALSVDSSNHSTLVLVVPHLTLI